MPGTYAHFIGIGGAGMSGIALVLHERGISVTGSDLKESRYSRALVSAGIPVSIGHDVSNVGDPDLVVVSAAIPDRNPELIEARRRGLEVWPRARMLAELSGDKKTIAVAGTHGKTSTSSMIATMLHGMKLDPTFLIGGEVDGFDTNARGGAGDHYVVEADESDGSFVHLEPHVAVITNIEADHLDHYESLAEIETTFAAFMERTVADGVIVACADDAVLTSMVRASGRRVVTYGFSADADVVCAIEGREGIGHRFTVTIGDDVTAAEVLVPGRHMVSNAAAALACAYALGLDVKQAARALSAFTGVRRRFDTVGEAGGVTVVDDYAHHPTEVKATLEAAAGLGYRRVWTLFQPHRYSRTEAFATQFGASFGACDRLVLTEVYSAGEAPIPGVSGKSLVTAVLATTPRAQVAYLPHRGDIVPFICGRVTDGDLVITMGAGDVTGIGPEIIAALQQRGSARCL